jgi:hypothetical protein
MVGQPWHMRVPEVDADIVVHLLKHGKVNVNLQTNSGETALSLASIRGYTNVVWELLKHNPCELLALALALANCQEGPYGKCMVSRRHDPSNTLWEGKATQQFDLNNN